MIIERPALSFRVQYPAMKPGACDIPGTTRSRSACSAASSSVIVTLTTTACMLSLLRLVCARGPYRAPARTCSRIASYDSLSHLAIEPATDACTKLTGVPALPAPMLAKSEPLPEGDYAYELKFDGFRAIVSTTGGLRVRSRRGWDMTSLVPKLADLPPRLTLDGELVAFGEDKLPSFPRLCTRMLHRERGVAVAYVIFDVLEWRELQTLNWPCRQRRELLEDLNLRGSQWDTAMSFDEGQRLFKPVRTRPRIVAKKLSQLPTRRTALGQGEEHGLLALNA
jgi:ATP dependent DNA ligase domain